MTLALAKDSTSYTALPYIQSFFPHANILPDLHHLKSPLL